MTLPSMKRFRQASVSPADAISNGEHQQASVADRFREAVTNARKKCETLKDLFLLVGASIGLFVQIIALALPEWFIISNNNIVGHIGFFSRCVYGPRANDSSCTNEIVHETAAAVAMFFVSLMSAVMSMIFGIYHIKITNCRPPNDGGKSSHFLHARNLMIVSGVSSLCAMGVFTYLYHDFLLPPAASYLLGWISTIILLTCGGLGFYFRSSSANNLETTIPYDDAMPNDQPVTVKAESNFQQCEMDGTTNIKNTNSTTPSTPSEAEIVP